MIQPRDFAALRRLLQQQSQRSREALQAGLGEVADVLDAALREQLAPLPELADGISHEVQGAQAVVGSGSEALLLRELGTAALPPQGDFMLAVEHGRADIENRLRQALERGLRGG